LHTGLPCKVAHSIAIEIHSPKIGGARHSIEGLAAMPVEAKAIVKSLLPPITLPLVRRLRAALRPAAHPAAAQTAPQGAAPTAEHTPAQLARHHLFDEQRNKPNLELFDATMSYLCAAGEMATGDYYEFGICGAGQFRCALAIAHKWGLDDMRFFAFDSFKGLPATGHLTMTESDFLDSIRAQGIFVDKVETIKGFYTDTLTDALRQQFVARKRPAVFVNVDCDLHESAVPVFAFIEPLIQPGTVIYMDDFYASFICGQRQIHGGMWGTARAFFDFAARSSPKFYPFMNAGNWGRAFMAYDPSIPSGPPV
jgi:hypothetical protein